MGFFEKLVAGLGKTRDNIVSGMDSIFHGFSRIDDDFYEELEEVLIMGDLGVKATYAILDDLRKKVKEQHIKEPIECRQLLIDSIKEQMDVGETAYEFENQTSVVLVIGVNGVGKTTTIGKLAGKMRGQGKKVVLAAADTFRAAAGDQLKEWAHRSDADLIGGQEGADPAAIVYDAVAAAKARKADILLVDTAGRLHNKKNLMDELAKMYRIIDRELPYSDREVLLVLDATTGQNAVNQAREFMNAAEITGIVLTKLDGTARGGVVLTIKNELGIPVKFIGVGEQIDDLQPFNPRAFADGLFEKIDYNEEDEKDGISQEDVAPDGQIIQADGSQQIGHTDKDEQSGKDEDKKEEGKVKADADAADESGVHGLEQSEKDIEDAPSDAEEPKKKKEKKRFGFFNRHS